jgi:hypothetical protein
MKANHIAVMSLEEYAWNPEFIGRNFNAGEVVQLVLRSRSGAWLPFKYVQMTMMHELAHCKQMNHSGAFWKVRNAYAEEMRVLWSKSYLGEGLWGRGRGLETGRFMHDVMPDTSELPEHTCGGTYRRRGRKRKRGMNGQEGKTRVSYAERKQRRILKKFGDPEKAVTLGTDEDVRVKLEDGKKPKGKPRVAGSNRGRELRAAAALARFEKQTKNEEIKQEDNTDSDTEDDFDWPATDNESESVKRDGKDFVRICEAEDEQDENVKREMEELYDLHSILEAPSSPKAAQFSPPPSVRRPTKNSIKGTRTEAEQPPPEGSETESDSEIEALLKPQAKPTAPPQGSSDTESEPSSVPFEPTKPAVPPSTKNNSNNTCPACSLTNDSSSLLCIACSNVLQPSKMANHWRCSSEACRGGSYINAGDYGRCQVCGCVKPS